MRLVMALLVLSLAGCADMAPPVLLSSGEALAQADAAIEGRFAHVALLHVQAADETQPSERTLEWYTEQGFTTDHPKGALDQGLAGAWIVSYAVWNNDEPAYPDHVAMQVMSHELREQHHPSTRTADPHAPVADGVGHHNADDVCFGDGLPDARQDMDILDDVVDSAAVMAKMADDEVLRAFWPDVADVSLTLSGMQSSYGNEGYWCYEKDEGWEVIADAEDGRAFRAYFTPDGQEVAKLDWTDAAPELHQSDHEWTTIDIPIDHGRAKTVSFPIQIGEDALHANLFLSASPASGAADIRLRLTDPAGTDWQPSGIFDASHAWFDLDFPMEGEWTVTYTYTAGIGLWMDHDIRAYVSVYGN